MDEPKNNNELDNFKPIGTIAIMALFLVMLIALWTSVYLILMARGATL